MISANTATGIGGGVLAGAAAASLYATFHVPHAFINFNPLTPAEKAEVDRQMLMYTLGGAVGGGILGAAMGGKLVGVCFLGLLATAAIKLQMKA